MKLTMYADGIGKYSIIHYNILVVDQIINSSNERLYIKLYKFRWRYIEYIIKLC